MKKLYSNILAIGLSFLFCNQAKAEDNYAIRLLLADNSSVTCALSQNPEMTFGDGKITLTTPEATIGSWEFSEVVKWNFIDATELSVKGVEAGKTQVLIQDDMITITSEGKQLAQVFDASGKMCISTYVGEDSKISLASLGTGIYILKIGDNTLKFVRK